MRLLLITSALFLVACGSDGRAAPTDAQSTSALPATVDQFNARAAFALMRRQVAVGQRPAGSRQLRKLARVLRKRLPEGRFEAVPGERGLRNVVAVVPGTRPALVIGAHYDTLVKPKGFVGANNGAAGTAIVVQLAREVAAADRPAGAPEVRFVLFDGEEPARGLPEEQTNFYETGLRGSRAYVARHRRELGAMVLLDYVANKGLRLPREATSTPELWDELRIAALQAGAGKQFPLGTGPAITDDHTPFLRAGIPAIDLIDWTYPGHSLEDGMDKLSLRSTNAVGETVRGLIDGWRP